jgi:uncharacterized membrane protein YgcG
MESGVTIEEHWRKALASRGKEAVKAELQMRPGPLDDVIYGIAYEAPFPNRAFCQQWCIEQDNKVFSFSWRLPVIVVGLLVFALGAFEVAEGLSDPRLGNLAAPHMAYIPEQPVSGAGQPQSQGSSNPSAGSAASSMSSSGGSSSSTTSGSSGICSYVSYDTAQCGRIPTPSGLQINTQQQ